MLIPYKLTMTGEEQEYFEKVLPNLTSLGFDVEQNGRSYVITAVPEPVSKINFAKFFADLVCKYAKRKQIDA